ncbi:MAG: hypothetical protein IH987_17450 [Planctomycetes bacterium]|nr:hypothetical protein [Planctomycetota bacterium]
MKQSIRTRSQRVALALAAALSGGSVFGACEARIKSALVDGTTSYINSGLLPVLSAAALEALVGDTAESFMPDAESGE